VKSEDARDSATQAGACEDDVDGRSDVALRTRKVERLIVAGVIIGPLLLGLWRWDDGQTIFGPRTPSIVFGYLLNVTTQLAMLGLTVWLAWRHPI
jgi:hypothetical protein